MFLLIFTYKDMPSRDSYPEYRPSRKTKKWIMFSANSFASFQVICSVFNSSKIDLRHISQACISFLIPKQSKATVDNYSCQKFKNKISLKSMESILLYLFLQTNKNDWFKYVYFEYSSLSNSFTFVTVHFWVPDKPEKKTVEITKVLIKI